MGRILFEDAHHQSHHQDFSRKGLHPKKKPSYFWKQMVCVNLKISQNTVSPLELNETEPGIWWSCPASFVQTCASAPSVFPPFSEPGQHRFVSHWALSHSSHLQPSLINKRLAVLCILVFFRHTKKCNSNTESYIRIPEKEPIHLKYHRLKQNTLRLSA